MISGWMMSKTEILDCCLIVLLTSMDPLILKIRLYTSSQMRWLDYMLAFMPDLSFDKMNVLIQQGASVITATSSQHVTPGTIFYFYILFNGLVQERRNSIANALSHQFDIRIQVIIHACPNFNGSVGMDPPQQTSLAPCWPNVDPVGSTLGQRGPNVPCYWGWEITFCSLYGCNNLCLYVNPRVLCNIGYLSETPLESRQTSFIHNNCPIILQFCT